MKEQSKIAGVYLITNKVNGKVYVGQSSDLEQRKKTHIQCSRQANRRKSPLYVAMREYGLDAFEWTILLESDSLKQRLTIEQEYIELFKELRISYNKQTKTHAPHKFTESEKEKMSLAHKKETEVK